MAYAALLAFSLPLIALALLLAGCGAVHPPAACGGPAVFATPTWAYSCTIEQPLPPGQVGPPMPVLAIEAHGGSQSTGSSWVAIVGSIMGAAGLIVPALVAGGML